MICPKCKTEVNSQDVHCPTCGLRLKFKCPKCGNLTTIGSSTCSVCGFNFVKFCPICKTANYSSAQKCRKCSYVFEKEVISLSGSSVNKVVVEPEPKVEFNFEDFIPKEEKPKEPEVKQNIPPVKKEVKKEPKKEVKKEKAVPPEIKNIAQDIEQKVSKLVLFVDFINLEGLFEKFKDEEFKQKVVLNIKTSVKLGFNAVCEFINPHVITFGISHTKNLKFLDKVKLFEAEFDKFNDILNETLGVQITYKFAVLRDDESPRTGCPVQSNYGIEKDIITSFGAYELLKEEIPLIKISPESYKMVFLDQKPVFEESESYNDDVALEMIYEALCDIQSDTRAVSINAPRGCGKSYLVDKIFKRLENEPYISLRGHCCALTQVAPYGLIQDICLSLFSLSFAPSKYEKRFQELSARFEQIFEGKIPQDKIDTLINLIYPTKEAYYENILENKERTFSDLKEILIFLKAKNRVIISIDDFDLIDETSYEFIKYLIEEDYFKSGAKLLLTYRNQHAIAMYLNTEKLPKNTCLNINLAKKEIQSVKDFIKHQLGDFDILPLSISNQIILNAQGNFAYVEQVLFDLIETKALYLEDKKFVFDKKEAERYIPNSLGELLEKRFEYLKENFSQEYKVLMVSSLLGGKFTKSLIERSFDITPERFEDIAALLEKIGYVKRITENIFEFKNSLVWTYIYAHAKEQKDLSEDTLDLLNEISARRTSSPAIAALLAQNVSRKELAFQLWTQGLKYASYLGDVNFYTLCQKQSLILLEEVKMSNFEYIKNNICERLGKLIYLKSPKEAVEYLTNAIVSAQKQQDENKVIELSGYLIQCCKISQNYNAVCETVDTVLSIYSKPKQELQRALIKTRKLEALLQLGNWSEITSLVNNEINPVLQNFLKRPKKNEFATIREVYETWISANIILAESYAQQGSPLAFQLIEEIQKELAKDKSEQSVKLSLHLAITSACANTCRGFICDSDEILQTILKDYSYVINDLKLVSKWNLIDLFNKIFSLNLDNIKDELFEATAFANNCGDEYTKNIIKTLLAYVLLKENNALKALEICAQQMTYFSDKKVALGALLAWYISALATLPSSGPDRCIEICEKAVLICENVKINSTIFKVLFQGLMSRAYLKKDDLENAKMYCELALSEANANELIYMQMKLYRLRANIMQDTLPKCDEDKKSLVAQNTVKVYEKAATLAQRLGLEKHHYEVQKELTAFKAYCQLNRIS